MKIRLSELRQIVREEIENIVKESSPEDDSSYQNIMAMITQALGDSETTKKLGGDLQQAFASKPVNVSKTPTMRPPGGVAPQANAPTGSQQTGTPQSISMKSVAQKPGQQQQQQPGETISMRSIAQQKGQ